MPRKSRKKRSISKRQRRILWIIVIAFILVSLITIWGYDWWLKRQSHFVTYREFGIKIPENYSIHGIDVSRYQDAIAWEKVKAMQVKKIKIGFAFIKATEGINGKDRRFKRNWKKSKESGVIRGAYHFFLATKDGRAQAQNFIKSVDLEPGDLPPVVDIEQTYGVNTAIMRRELKEWLAVVENHYGVQPIIYTNVDFYKSWLGKEFDHYPLWAAHYWVTTQPRITRNWIFWQHSEEGRVSGITSKVDFNVFNGDSIAFRQLLVK